MRAFCRRVALRFAWACFVVYGPVLLLELVLLAGFGPWGSPNQVLYLMIPAVSALVGFIAFVQMSNPVARVAALERLVVCLGLMMCALPAILLGSHINLLSVRLAAERGAPLIDAIARYQQERGAPPSSLEELTPQYLDALPARMPPVQLYVGAQARERFAGNAWALVAPIGKTPFDWDSLVYLPEGNYADLGPVQRAGAWAYRYE